MDYNTNEIIKATAADMGLPYELGSYAQLNTLLDRLRSEKQYPVCVCIQSTDGRLLFDDGAYLQTGRDQPRVRVGFADRIPLDYDPETVEGQIAELKRTGARFIARLNGSGRFEHIAEAVYTVMFDRFDANLVLVLFDFELRETEGECLTDMEG